MEYIFYFHNFLIHYQRIQVCIGNLKIVIYLQGRHIHHMKKKIQSIWHINNHSSNKWLFHYRKICLSRDSFIEMNLYLDRNIQYNDYFNHYIFYKRDDTLIFKIIKQIHLLIYSIVNKFYLKKLTFAYFSSIIIPSNDRTITIIPHQSI